MINLFNKLHSISLCKKNKKKHVLKEKHFLRCFLLGGVFFNMFKTKNKHMFF